MKILVAEDHPVSRKLLVVQLRAADEALYRSKKLGRNRAEIDGAGSEKS